MSTSIPLDKILPNPEQPRQIFDQEYLEELAESIQVHGVILPISVERAADGFFILHDGERRTRAARMAGLKTIPADIRPPLNGTGPRERLERALVANIQRADLDPIEEAKSYARLKDEFGLSVDKIVLRLGLKNRNRVDNGLRMLQLEAPVQTLIAERRLPRDMRVINALLSIPDSQARVQTAQELVKKGGTKIHVVVRACEQVKNAIKAAEEHPQAAIPPALHLAQRKEKTEKLPTPEWDALYQINRVPPWQAVADAAMATCDGCAFRSIASAETCGQCPLPDFLADLIKRTQTNGQNGRH